MDYGEKSTQMIAINPFAAKGGITSILSEGKSNMEELVSASESVQAKEFAGPPIAEQAI